MTGWAPSAPKAHCAQSYGTVDELNSHLGLALALGLCDRLAAIVPEIQNELFDVGTELCFVEEDKKRYPLPHEERHIRRLEDLIDELNESVGPLENFILAGGSPGGAAPGKRTVCRRAEREVTALARGGRGSAYAIYLNRLSGALFVMALREPCRGVVEPLWQPGK